MTDRKAGPDQMKLSDETNAAELPLSKAEGKAFAAAVLYMANVEAEDGGEKDAGDYIVGYAVEHAEGLYHMREGKLRWENPTDENAHIEIVVRNAEDGRFLPGLKVRATLTDSSGRDLGTHEMPFLWHPWLYHYGRNWQVPGDGNYKLHVHIDPPDYPRHDLVNGKRFEKPADVDFDIRIKTGRKVSKAA